ncbi:GAF domain-containing protein [Sporofaciens musculi]|jgi:GAF domain-containing protein|uniref:GAF domain-containing protein n=1 Tax=Sporofaciens musculi TaxID=2681861 RepID=UPI00258DEEE9|nr:GAF domain-containing protein [Sporofaciens musculi]
MKASLITYPTEKKELYRLLKTQLQGLVDGVTDLTANLANVSALLNQALTDINWVGFYLMKEGRLILGPFQGKPACVEIEVGRGVCGAAAVQDQVMRVENVHEFPGHIACDSASLSEIVIPIHNAKEVIGVLDIDSPHLARFDEEDQRGLSELVRILEVLLTFDKRTSSV